MRSEHQLPEWPAVSVISAVRDEEHTLRACLRAVLDQDYPGPLEVVVAVAPSGDATEAIAREVAATDGRVRVVANPALVTPAGLNAALAHATGAVVARVDGHARWSAGYLRRAVELLRDTGAANVGGVMAAEGTTPFERAVAAAMSSRFGTGDARFHYGGPPGPVDTVYLGVFRREVLEALGGYDESFARAQDAELNHRIRQAGGVVYFHPDLRVAYRPRSSLRALARQYFHYGRWRRVVVRRHRGALAWRQLVPPAALAGNLVGLLAGLSGRRLGWLLPGTYLAAVVAGTLLAGRRLDLRSLRHLPAAFVVMHGAWAVGFLTSPRGLVPATPAADPSARARDPGGSRTGGAGPVDDEAVERE